MADLDVPLGQHMQQEPADELLRGDAFAIPFLGVEDNLLIGDFDEAVVADPGSMGVAAKILKHALGAAKWRLGVDDPGLSVQGVNKATKCLWVSELCTGLG